MRPLLTRGICPLIAIAYFTLAAQLVRAQTATPDPPRQARQQSGFVLRETVRRVILDVVVTDSQGKAVPGLMGRDFSVAESGKPQKVLSFEEHDFPALKDAALPSIPPLPANTFVNIPTQQERGPLYVIVYDAIHSSPQDQPRARQHLMDFLAGKPAGTRFELFILSDRLHLAQGFTTDPQKLLDVFDTHRKSGARIPWNFLYGSNFITDYDTEPMWVLAYIARYLQGLPGRKNLLWISSRMPIRLALAGPVSGSLGAQDSNSGSDYEDALKETIDELTAAQVSVYPVDIHGPDPDSNGGGIDSLADEIADDTGGHAYYNTNDVKGALEAATERGSRYYELTYSPTNQKYDGSLRRIHVELSGDLAKQGYRLAYRRGYYGTDIDSPMLRDKQLAELPDHPFATKQSDALVAHLQHGAPMDHGLFFRAHVSAGPPTMATADEMANFVDEAAYLRARRKNKPVKLPTPVQIQHYAIDYTLLDRGLNTSTGRGGGAVLEFAAAVYDVEGKLLNGVLQPALRISTAGGLDPNPKGLYRIRQTLDVPSNSLWLRLAVRDLNSDSMGTLEIPLPLTGEPPAEAAGTKPTPANLQLPGR